MNLEILLKLIILLIILGSCWAFFRKKKDKNISYFPMIIVYIIALLSVVVLIDTSKTYIERYIENRNEIRELKKSNHLKERLKSLSEGYTGKTTLRDRLDKLSEETKLKENYE